MHLLSKIFRPADSMLQKTKGVFSSKNQSVSIFQQWFTILTFMDTVFNHFSSGNFQLLVDYGLMKPLDKGTHYYLPILQRSIDRTCAVIERFMNKIEAQKITIPNLTPVEMWQDSGMNLTQLLEQKSSECLSLSLDEDFFMVYILSAA